LLWQLPLEKAKWQRREAPPSSCALCADGQNGNLFPGVPQNPVNEAEKLCALPSTT